MPPERLAPNAPTAELLPLGHLLRPDADGARRLPRRRSQNLMQPADVGRCRSARRSCARSIPARCCSWSLGADVPRARRRRPPPANVPQHVPPPCAPTRHPARELLAPCAAQGAVHARGADDPRAQLGTPTQRPATSPERTLLDRQARQHKAVRLVFRTGGSDEYWGIRRRTGTARRLADKSFQHDLGAASSSSTTRARTSTWSCCACTTRATGS